MPVRIVKAVTYDVRFPTSRSGAGSDAMNLDPDYSAAYAIVRTDDGGTGHGFTFTIGRGNEVCAEAIRAFTPLVVGRDVDEILAEPAAFWRALAGDSQLRWLGPEKGVIHISMAAIVNAVGPIRQVVRGEGSTPRRYLVIVSGTPGQPGSPVQVQVP